MDSGSKDGAKGNVAYRNAAKRNGIILPLPWYAKYIVNIFVYLSEFLWFVAYIADTPL